VTLKSHFEQGIDERGSRRARQAVRAFFPTGSDHASLED
jgi:hypothetical protein